MLKKVKKNGVILLIVLLSGCAHQGKTAKQWRDLYIVEANDLKQAKEFLIEAIVRGNDLDERITCLIKLMPLLAIQDSTFTLDKVK